MDIFISYTHVDNLPLEEGRKGWVDDFHRALQVRVIQWLGRAELEVWRDPKLAGNDMFDDEIAEQLRRVRVLVSVLSPRYLKSEYCSRELNEFYGAATRLGRLTVLDNKARIFKVVKTPIPLEEQPAPLKPLLGYEFFQVDPQSGRAREFLEIFGAEARAAFWLRMDDLARDVATLLEAMVAESADPAAAVPEGRSVYLAAATRDLGEEHAAVRRELERNGYTVLPRSPLPIVAAEIEEQARAELAGCSLAVILVGREYGFVPEGGTTSVVEMQEALAGEWSRAGTLARLIWTPPGLKVEDERQGAFLERLRSGDGFDERTDLLETRLEDLKTEIHDRLRAFARPPREAAPAPARATVYLVCDRLDLDGVGALRDALLGQGLDPVLPVFEGEEAELREEHEERLRSCDAVILYYGGGTDLWLSRKTRELRKIGGQGRGRPMLAQAIFVAPPSTPAKELLASHEWEIIRQERGFDPRSLEPFLARLQGGRS